MNWTNVKKMTLLPKFIIGFLFIIGTLYNLSAQSAQRTFDGNNDAIGGGGKDEEIKNVHYLEPGSIYEFKPVYRHIGFKQSIMNIYCYKGMPKTLWRFFETIELQLEIDEDDYTQYEGVTPKEVHKHYDENRSLFSINLFSTKRSRLQLSPFGQHCIGVETSQGYRVRLHQLRVDFWRVLQFGLALLLFIYAGHLSHNSVFYYASGVLIGIFSSFLLLVYFASKFMPRRPMMVGVLIGGWTLGIYLLQLLWENLQVIVMTYRSYVFWYIVVTGMASFLICYRFGPPKNKRSKNIIKWVLQFTALVMIYLCSYFEEATVAAIISLGIFKFLPEGFIRKIRSAYRSRFPPKRRLLTNEEYYVQGVRETTKALEELRAYASSPECKQWKVMSKLKNPRRFAAFVEGASHLRDEEILRFEGSQTEQDFDTEDDNDDSNDEIERNRNLLTRNRIENHDDISEASDGSDEVDAYAETYPRTVSKRVVLRRNSNSRPLNRGNELSLSEEDDSECRVNSRNNSGTRNISRNHVEPSTTTMKARFRRSVSNGRSNSRGRISESRTLTAEATSPTTTSNYSRHRNITTTTTTNTVGPSTLNFNGNPSHNMQRRSFGRSSIHSNNNY